MLALANARVAKFENRQPVLEKVAMTITVVNALSDRIAAALEASPPASLAFAGLRLILNGCARGIAASQDCLDGLTRVVSRLEWYLGLSGFILADGAGAGPDTLEPPLIAAAGVVSAYLRARIVDLFVALIEYQIKSVCAYYRTNQLVTFLRDLAELDDWKSWLASIEDSEARLLRDVESYDGLKASRLRNQLAEHAKEGNSLLHSLVEQSKEASERDARREQREQRQLDEATRARINKLISTFSIPGLAYKTFKNSLNPEVAPNTGIWLREHSKYTAWEAQPSGILVLAAPPGCGKSVLARSIADEWLVNARHDDDTVVCYFFFKDAPMQTSLANGLCAVLHQLFDQRPEAVLAVSDEIERANEATLRGDPDALWDLFTTALDHLGDAVTTKCVFDALDEADANSCDTLIRFLRQSFSGDSAKRFKVFATCRPYETVLQPLASIQSGLVNLEAQDEELEDISREIDCVIDHKLQLLARRDRNPPPAPVVEKIRESLKAPGNRTYLWVRLVFEVIEGTSTAYREKQWLRPLVSLPQSVDEAYEALLRRVPDEDQHAVRELISMVLAMQELNQKPTSERLAAAQRAVQELDEGADSEEEGASSEQDISLEAFEKWLTNTCGFLLHVFRGEVAFIHQTAKEFLLAQARAPAPPIREVQFPTSGWKNAFVPREGHRIMAEACISALEIRDWCRVIEDWALWDEVDRLDFESYAAYRWHQHFEKCQWWDTTDEGIPDSLVDIRESLLPKYRSLASLNAASVVTHLRSVLDLVTGGEERRLRGVLKQLCAAKRYDDAAWWILHYFPTMATLQIPQGDVGFYDDDDQEMGSTTFLHLVSFAPLARRLLAHGADIAARDDDGKTPLHFFVRGKYFDTTSVDLVLLALDAGADVHAQDFQGRMPIHDCDDVAALGILVAEGVDVNARDGAGQTRLHTCVAKFALRRWSEGLVGELIRHGADVSARDDMGRTPLHNCRNEDDALQLIEHGADVHARDESGRTPLHVCVAESMHSDLTEFLIEHGADVNAEDEGGQTPLHTCVTVDIGQSDTMAVTLMNLGADVNAVDQKRRTPLHLCSAEWFVEALVARGADLGAADIMGRTPLHTASSVMVARSLIRHGASLAVRDLEGRTVLHHWAANDTALIRELFVYGIPPLEPYTTNSELASLVSVLNARDRQGSTALLVACRARHVSWVGFLLESGADATIPDDTGLLPLQAYFEGRPLQTWDETFVRVANDLVAATGDGSLSEVPGLFTQKTSDEIKDQIRRCKYWTGELDMYAGPHIGRALFMGVCFLLDHGFRLDVDDADPDAAMFALIEDGEARQRYQTMFDKWKWSTAQHGLVWNRGDWAVENLVYSGPY